MSKSIEHELSEALERLEIELNALGVLRERIAEAQQHLDAMAKEFLSEEGYAKYVQGESKDSE